MVEWNSTALAKIGATMDEAKQAVAESDPARATASVIGCLKQRRGSADWDLVCESVAARGATDSQAEIVGASRSPLAVRRPRPPEGALDWRGAPPRARVALGERLVAMTAHEDAAIGGLVRRAAFAPGAEAHIELLHRGRALAVVRRQMDEAWITVVSIHHIGMSVSGVKAVARRSWGLVDEAQRDPTLQLVLVAGDFNCDSRGETPWCSAGGRGAHRACAASVRGAATQMTELFQAHARRCEMASILVVTRTDRIYFSALDWVMVALAARLWTHGELVPFFTCGFSEHMLVVA